jgi:hypothetical protein
MLTVLSSPKAGSGVSTTAALLALAVCHDTPTHLVDLCGDQTPLLGLTDRPDPTVQGFDGLTVHDLTDATVDDQVAVIRRLAALGGHVIIDAGVPTHPINPNLPAATVRHWVLRPCYLGLRRATACPVRPDEVILLEELGRGLTARDVEAVTGARVTATVEVHPQIARAVDAGLLTGRAPTTALAELARLARSEEAARP